MQDKSLSHPEEAILEELPKGRRSFAKMRRELTEEELSTPAVQKILMDDIERLESENEFLTEYKDKYHEADKLAAILKEREKRNIAMEIVHGVGLTVGAVLVSSALPTWESQPLGWILLICGAGLFIGSIIAKVVTR